MGIGMVAIVSERDAKRAMSFLPGDGRTRRGEKANQIGRIERGSGETRLCF